MATETYDRLVAKAKEIKLLAGVSGLLGWDQETYMPAKAGEVRSDQMALLAGLLHDKVVASEIGDLLATLEKEKLSAERAAVVRETRRSHDRERKLPKELVEEMARTTSRAQEAWAKARKEKDFPAFAPWLEKVLDLKRQVAKHLGTPGQEPYDALLDEFEPGCTSAELTALFTRLEAELVPLVKKIVSSKKKPRVEILERRYAKAKQEEFGRLVAKDMGFDFEAGRLDVSAHPFCSGLAPDDVRITTRYAEDDLTGSLFGIMHEAGHGLYEQGFDRAWYGTPLAEACSTGVHESQSRLWENMVGRSRSFWRHYFPKLREFFPEPLADVSEADFVFAVNDVRPSFIRTEADEVTYNLHVLLRFEVERDLLSKKLSVSDLPRFWNDKFEKLLGVRPADDAQGCLQDIHWSFGLFAYFPTYTLGNCYAAQIHAAADKELGLDARLAKGELKPLREWLREKVHARGMLHRPKELVKAVTGAPPSPEPFMKYLNAKYGELFGF
ncbi:MAG: carboxypeptidase M32 [Planctomycetota bacterium]